MKSTLLTEDWRINKLSNTIKNKFSFTLVSSSIQFLS